MAGTWQALTHQPPFPASTMLLLTNGTVFCQEAGGKKWWRLEPDINGNYLTGSWSPLSPMAHTRLYFASAVLKDGRVFVAGGEYSDGGGDLNAAEIYNPASDSWTSIPTPAGWTHIGDAPCCVLPDGRVLLGSIGGTQTAIYDPIANTWSAAASKDDSSSEETWTLLPDETVLSVECSHHPKAEKYIAPADRWVNAGSLPIELVQASSIEIGPAILMPDGRVFAIGATGHTALYSPPALANQPGAWTRGPDFPLDANGKLMEAKDAPACLLPNGKVLCAVGPAGEGGSFPGPTHFFEYDGVTLHPAPTPPTAGGPPFVGRMLLLPTGQVLFANGSASIEVYTPDGVPDEDWRPEITSYPHDIRPLHTYVLQGRLLNGLSQAVSYGDDASMATNYPLVRITSLATGRVRYCRTFDHSTMGVATGLSIQSTSFQVPFGIPAGRAELTVIADGIASQPVLIMVAPFVFPWWVAEEEEMVNFLIGSLADGPLWVLTPHGPVPVDPMDEELVQQTRVAYEEIINGVERLQKIGGAMMAERFVASQPGERELQPSGGSRQT